ncbi:hypothetical protein, partial [Klebsiella pneumoniae]|uniref:hypothetical protein n=1 Tax=Klebsiella pneumoniae TaxID=573 RepID=UPI001E4C0C7F
PALRPRYARLVAAHLRQRPSLDDCPAADAELEIALRRALAEPGSVERFPRVERAPWPVPLWLYPDEEPASVSANAVYYSDDWGSSWRRLDIAGYLGVLVFDETHDRVFWARGNWYDSRDLGVQAYELD